MPPKSALPSAAERQAFMAQQASASINGADCHQIAVGQWALLSKPCGTSSLSPCVGVIVDMGGGQIFVAHIQNSLQISERASFRYQLVVHETHQFLTTATRYGNLPDTRIAHVGTEFPNAINSAPVIDGVRLWASRVVVFPHSSIGMDSDGQIKTILGGGLNRTGADATVPPDVVAAFVIEVEIQEAAQRAAKAGLDQKAGLEQMNNTK